MMMVDRIYLFLYLKKLIEIIGDGRKQEGAADSRQLTSSVRVLDPSPSDGGDGSFTHGGPNVGRHTAHSTQSQG
jgi:hypothetical protein